MFSTAHAKKKGNYNAEVTRPTIMWPTNLIYATTLPYLCIKSSLASLKKEVLCVSEIQACQGNYLQINAFSNPVVVEQEL